MDALDLSTLWCVGNGQEKENTSVRIGPVKQQYKAREKCLVFLKKHLSISMAADLGKCKKAPGLNITIG